MENDVALAIVRNDLEQMLALADPGRQKVSPNFNPDEFILFC